MLTIKAIGEAITSSRSGYLPGDPRLPDCTDDGAAAVRAIEAAGYAIVPVELTQDMISAWYQCHAEVQRHKAQGRRDYCVSGEWAAMIAAAPKIELS